MVTPGIWNRLTLKRRTALYEGWVRSYADELYRSAYRRCGDPDSAEDLVQETFYHAWKDMGTLRDRRKARAWLHQILRHRYAHQVRHDSRRVQTVPGVDGKGEAKVAVDGRPSPLSELSARDDLQRALDRLDDAMKTPLLMVFLDGLTCRETAQALDIPLGTVLSRLHRARQKMRAALKTKSEGAEEPEDEQPGGIRLVGGARDK